MMRDVLRKLRAEFNKISPDLPPDSDVRFRRCFSWLSAADKAQENDSRLMFLWIAFNALYGTEGMLHPGVRLKEREYMRELIKTAARFDREGGVILASLQAREKELRDLLSNRYAFNDYWKSIAEREGERGNWEQAFNKRNEKAWRSFETGKVKNFLWEAFDRLYELRSQIFHGGAAFGDLYNRSQTEAAARILESVVPAIVSVMLDHPKHNWGAVMTPPQAAPNEPTDKARLLRNAPAKKKQPL